MRRYIRTGLLVFFLTVSSVAKGQDQLIFESLVQSDGLSNGSITTIAQGPEGFIWIGTKNGLNRYDGNRFKVYNKSNSSFEVNDISVILFDNKGQMLIGTTGGGFYLYHPLPDQFTVFRYDKTNERSISSDRVTAIVQDNKGQLWIGTEAGLNLFNEEDQSFERYIFETSDSLSASFNHISAMVEDSKGNLWIGTFGGGLNLLEKNESTFKHYDLHDQGADFIHALAILNDNEILLGTSGAGLRLFNTNTYKVSAFADFKKPEFSEPKIVRVIYRDSKGTIWVGSDGNGLFAIDPNGKRVRNFMNDNRQKSSIISNSIYSVLEDKDLNLWIGSAWHGLSVAGSQQQQFEFYYSDILANKPAAVLSIYEDNDRLFFGSDGQGLTFYNFTSDQLNIFNDDNGNSVGGDFIQFIKPGRSGDYWIGTFANGLISFDFHTQTTRQYLSSSTDANSISFNDVRDIVEDTSGGAWVATWGGGLNYFNIDKSSFKAFKNDPNDPQSVSSNNVLALEERKDRKLWVATFGGGVNILDPVKEIFIRYMHNDSDTNSISGDNVLSIHTDSRGYTWFGTWEDGVSRFDPDKGVFENFDKRHGLSDNTVTAILEDNFGDLWLSTKNGITKYDYSLDQFVAPNFLKGEYHINSACKGANGKLYFGNLEGVIAIEPENIQFSENPLEVKLIDLKLFNHSISPEQRGILNKQVQFQEQVAFEYDQNVITLEFAALKFPYSGDVEYAIKLENFDEDWREIGALRMTTYTNLAPGDYNFKVKARLPGHSWSDQATSLKILILKPLWQRWWAYMIYVILFLALLYLFRVYTVSYERIKAKLRIETINREKDAELNHLKLRFFTNISHEIRTPITLILGSVNQLLGTTSNKSENAKMKIKDAIRKNSDHLLQLVEELLDFRKIDSEGLKISASIEDFVNYSREIFLSFVYLAEKNNIQYQLKSPQDTMMLWFDPNQLEKVVYNLLSNAFKYTPEGGTIRLNIEEDSQYGILTIADSGKGIEVDQLQNIFERFYQSDNKPEATQRGY